MPSLTISPALEADRPLIQEMARFYIYEMSDAAQWGYERKDAGVLFECRDLSAYWDDGCHPYLLLSEQELGGFALIDRRGSDPRTQFNVGQFFVLKKFQRRGLGRRAATAIFERHPGCWEVAQFPGNLPAIAFWQATVRDYTAGRYSEERRYVEHLELEMNVISFTSPGARPAEPVVFTDRVSKS